MKYFRFFPDCHYITGPCNSSLYSLANGEVISFNQIETEIIKGLLSNVGVDDTKKKYGSVAEELIKQLLKGAYGTLFNKPVYTEGYLANSNWESTNIFASPPILRLAYIQLNDECSISCNFCGNNSYSYWQGCNSCLRWPMGAKGKKLDREIIERTILQMNNFSVSNIIFSGGDPLISWPDTIEVIKYTKNLNSNIHVSICTNGIGLSYEVIQEAIDFDISFIFTIFADNPLRYQKVTGSKELFCGVCNAIEECKKHNIKYSICLLIAPEFRNYYQELYNFAIKLGGISFFTTEVLPKAGDKKPIISLPIDEKRIENTTPEVFFFRHRFNTCLHGTIAFSCNGSTTICPMWESAISELPDGDLLNSFKSDRVDTMWRYCKSKVPICGDCEYKFACSDCSVLEWAITKDPSMHDCFCLYNPQKGKWGEMIPEE